ncbi:MAG: hypothetical protein OXI69_02045 [Acidobacteriota bacterium]|nr:hypothetical protein [Acidobacteriota bacterium]
MKYVERLEQQQAVVQPKLAEAGKKQVATSLRKSFACLQDEYHPVCEIVGEP